MFGELLVNVLASVILLGFGFVFGKFRERRARAGRNLDEYDFYPVGLDEKKTLFFDTELFNVGVRHFGKHRDETAARQLILIGEQNDVRNQLVGEDLSRYKKFYSRYGGDKVLDDTSQFLENYKRIVRLIGDSFPDSGIEILLHNLVNPTKALTVIKNNVTGRNIEAPATNLVVDLKRRRLNNEDKLNYELNIGARRFKCTTIPIYREPFGLIGAICINVDVNFLQDQVAGKPEQIQSFIDGLCHTDMNLDENILSKNEYEKALGGKRHFRDHQPSAE